MSAKSSGSTFVLGFDGVPWRLVSRWVDSGDLPNFARLVNEGAAGRLKSTVPANTPIAWPTIATGARPDGHGIYEFVRLNDSYGQRPYNSTDLRRPPLWELLSPAAVMNVPMTYPAGGVNGRIVSGMMAPSVDANGFAHPPSFGETVREEIPEYAIGLDWKDYYGREEAFLTDLRDLVETRRKLLTLLREAGEYELYFAVFTAPDRLQHLVWDETTLREQYRYFDKVLGDVLEFCERDGRRLFVVSDHGFGEIDTTVNVNRLLLEEGLFARSEDGGIRQLLARVGVSKKRMLGALERIGITDDHLVAGLPDRLIDSVASHVPGDHGLYDMDPTRTDAFLHGLGSVYINETERFEDGRVPPNEVPAVKESVISTLRSLTDPETGERVLDVYDGADLHPRDGDAPDVVVEGRSTYRVTSSLADKVFGDPSPKVADHRKDGIFLAWGQDIRAGSAPENASVRDLVPTVLHAAGRPVPEYADGRVLEEVFSSGSDAASRSVRRTAYETTDRDDNVAEETEDVEDRLRGLGYLE